MSRKRETKAETEGADVFKHDAAAAAAAAEERVASEETHGDHRPLTDRSD